MAHNYAYSKFFLLIILSTIGASKSFAEIKKELRTEDDGYKWYLTSSNNSFGALSENGSVIIPLSKGYEWVIYTNGLLCGIIFNPDEHSPMDRRGYYDKSGKELISPLKYESAAYNEEKDDIPGWFSVWENGLEGACDKNGKEIVPPIYTGLLYLSKGFEGRKEGSEDYIKLGITLTGHNPMASVEKLIQAEKDGFIWYKLKDYPTEGAADKDGKILLPMSLQFTHINYITSIKNGKYGLFEVHRENNIGLYSIDGNEIISPDKGYTYLSYQGNSGNGYFQVDRGDAKYGFCDLNQSEIIAPGKYTYAHYNINGFFEVKQGEYKGICDRDGKELIIPNKYTSIFHINYENKPEWFCVKANNLEGACDINGKELIPPRYTNLYYDNEVGFYYKNNGDNIALNIKLSPVSVIKSSVDNSYSEKRVSSTMNNNQSSNSIKYAALSDPNLVDNSSKIIECEQRIRELEQQKKNCYLCHGTGKVPGKLCYFCSGTGTIKVGYSTPQFFTCNYCGGNGHEEDYCSECKNTNMSISITQGLLKTYKETHGMTKETESLYYGHHEKMRQIERDHQNAINAIADPYLNNPSQSATTTTHSNCSICNGTGVDPFPWEDGSTRHGQGIYTNQSGKKCPHCGRYTWHQHVRCPKCNAR